MKPIIIIDEKYFLRKDLYRTHPMYESTKLCLYKQKRHTSYFIHLVFSINTLDKIMWM